MLAHEASKRQALGIFPLRLRTQNDLPASVVDHEEARPHVGTHAHRRLPSLLEAVNVHPLAELEDVSGHIGVRVLQREGHEAFLERGARVGILDVVPAVEVALGLDGVGDGDELVDESTSSAASTSSSWLCFLRGGKGEGSYCGGCILGRGGNAMGGTGAVTVHDV